VRTSQNYEHSKIKETCPQNQWVLSRGLEKVLSEYKPSWFYFNGLFGTAYG